MARSYAKILLSIWSDPDFIDRTVNAKLAYFALVSQPKLTPAGCIALQPSKWAKTVTNGDSEAILNALHELLVYRFVLIDDDTEELLVRSFIRHDGGTRNPNLRKSILSAVSNIESPDLRAAAEVEFRRALENDQVTDSERESSEQSSQGSNGRRNGRHPLPTSNSNSNSNSQQQQQPHTVAQTVRRPDGTQLPPLPAAASDFDKAIRAAVEIRFLAAISIVSTPAFERATRKGIEADHASTIWTLLRQGADPTTAGLTAIGHQPSAAPQPPTYADARTYGATAAATERKRGDPCDPTEFANVCSGKPSEWIDAATRAYTEAHQA